MKILWCWRCQMEVPMLEGEEAKKCGKPYRTNKAVFAQLVETNEIQILFDCQFLNVESISRLDRIWFENCIRRIPNFSEKGTDRLPFVEHIAIVV